MAIGERLAIHPPLLDPAEGRRHGSLAYAQRKRRHFHPAAVQRLHGGAEAVAGFTQTAFGSHFAIDGDFEDMAAAHAHHRLRARDCQAGRRPVEDEGIDDGARAFARAARKNDDEIRMAGIADEMLGAPQTKSPGRQAGRRRHFGRIGSRRGFAQRESAQRFSRRGGRKIARLLGLGPGDQDCVGRQEMGGHHRGRGGTSGRDLFHRAGKAEGRNVRATPFSGKLSPMTPRAAKAGRWTPTNAWLSSNPAARGASSWRAKRRTDSRTARSSAVKSGIMWARS